MYVSLAQLELAIHDVDCDWPNHHDRGHGDKYTKMALAARAIFPPESEPGWLKDRRLIQETSLSMIVDRLDDLKVGLIGDKEIGRRSLEGKISQIIPTASFKCDLNGQLIIYTSLYSEFTMGDGTDREWKVQS